MKKRHLNTTHNVRCGKPLAFITYGEAKLATIKFDVETKIRRCGPNGTKFKT